MKREFWIKLSIFTVILLLNACKKEKTDLEIPHWPVVKTMEVSNLTYTTATLNGTVNPNGLPTTVTFEYGHTNSYGQTLTAQYPITGNDITNVRADISGLFPDTTYHFRVTAENSLWKNFSGSDKTFHTPVPETLEATNLTYTTATLNGTVNAFGISAIVTFEYGTTTSYGQEITAGQSPVTGNESTNVSAILSGLAEGIYHFRVKTINSAGTVYGNDMEFTICTSSPTVALLPATNINPTGVTLNGTVIANGLQTSVTFRYSIINRGGKVWKTVTADESPITGYGITNVSANVSGNPGSTHKYFITATNICGTVTSDQLSFTIPK